ncbi:MAG: hypothetical protein C5B51_06570 [Terriglobia bacterium]|nr:MAG: hypothetical protein C5B51_06570 [Terriglobia bacterium]
MRVWGGVTSIVALFLLSAPAKADLQLLGYISFDNLIPGDVGSPGVNGFTIGNLTGSNDLPPTFNVSTSLTFLNSSLEFFTGTSSQTVFLGDLGFGFFNPFSLMFPDTDTFTSALFTATLDTTSLQLEGGGVFTAASNQISVWLTPSSGDLLVAGTDFALITVSDEASPVPEPNSLVLLTLIFLALLVCGHTRLWKCTITKMKDSIRV